MQAVAILLFAGGIGGLVFLLARDVFPRKRKSDEDAGKRSLIARISGLLGQIPQYLFPRQVNRFRPYLNRQIAFAGLDELVWKAETLIGAYILGMLATSLLAFQIFAGWPPGLRILVGTGIGIFYVRARLNRTIFERQGKINKGFPYVLDLLHLCVNSGQGINTAIQQLSDAIGDGPIREEFARVINAVRHGMNLSEAFRRMNERVQAPEVRAVLLALIQAIERGTQVGEALALQAEQLRFSRLMSVEEQVQKLPTKMTLPVILFFMPCTLIVILGPIIISTALSFRGG